MSNYWNSVEIVNGDISGAAAKPASAQVSAQAKPSVAERLKAWGNDQPTVTIGNAGQSDAQFQQRARDLMPPFYKTQNEEADEATLTWEVEHRRRKAEVRNSAEYKFAMLIAGAANMKIERIWTTPSEDPKAMSRDPRGATNESGDSFLAAAPQMDDLAKAQQFQHQWSQVPEVSMEIHLSPQVYFQVQESLNMVQKHPKAKTVTVDRLIRNATMRTLFAGLVALNIKFSSFMSGLNYQLDANYKRLKRERNVQLMRIIAEVKKSQAMFI